MAFILVTVLLGSIGFGVVLPVLPGLIMNVKGEPRANAAGCGGIVYADRPDGVDAGFRSVNTYETSTS